MGRFQGDGLRRAKWLLVAAGLLSTGCAGAIGAGAAVVVVGAGVLGFTCYDRVAVTVTDRLTGTKLCDAKVTFLQGTSKSEATSCYTAALSAGQYTMRVERRGLETFEEPVEVTESGKCGQTVQTMFVALERKQRAPGGPQGAPMPAPVAPPPYTAPPVAPASTAPSGPPVTAPPSAAPATPPSAPSSAPLPAAPPAPSSAPLPAAPPAPSGAPATPPPASTAFPDAP